MLWGLLRLLRRWSVIQRKLNQGESPERLILWASGQVSFPMSSKTRHRLSWIWKRVCVRLSPHAPCLPAALTWYSVSPGGTRFQLGLAFDGKQAHAWVEEPDGFQFNLDPKIKYASLYEHRKP